MKNIIFFLFCVVQLSQQQEFGLFDLGGDDTSSYPGVKTERTPCTKSDKDVLVVVEAPTSKRFQAFINIRSFFASILSDTRGCYRLSFVVSDEEIITAKAMNSDRSYRSRIRTTTDTLNNNKPKENIVKVIENILGGEYFVGSSETSEKIIFLVVVTDSGFKSVPIADKMKSVLEERNNVIGSFGIPELKFTVLAAGIGDVSVEAGKFLEKLTFNRFDKPRTIKATSWTALDKMEKYSIYDRVVNLINDPNQASSLMMASSEQEGPIVRDANDGQNEICRLTIDIAFLVDSSHSIRLDWNKELYFVERIANRFEITEDKAHAGVVLFSDLKNFTKVCINMTDHLSNAEFNKAVNQLPYIGFRTRMDLGFEKVRNELFKPGNGVRSSKSVGRLVVLITDGKQNPVKENGEVYDPVIASQPIIDEGTVIIAVGIGADVDREQLNNITRDPTKVRLANSVDELITDDFVRSVSKKICEDAGTFSTPKPATTCVPTPKSCSGAGSCSSCCGSHDVYINIIQSSGNYLVQGMKVTSTGGQISGANVTPGPEVNTSSANGTPKTNAEIIALIQKLLPERVGLSDQLKNVLDNHQSNQPEGPGSPIVSGRPGVARNRRSLESLDKPVTPEARLLNIARFAGCRKFLNALEKNDMLDLVMKNAGLGIEQTIFCPTDEAYKKMYDEPQAKLSEKEILAYHLTRENFDTNSNVRLSLRKVQGGKVSWKANEANVALSLVNSGKIKIMLIDQVLYPNTKTLEETLRNIPEVSIFHQLLKKVSIEDIFQSRQIDKICFKSSLCVSLHESLKSKLNNGILGDAAFTVLAPTNRDMLKMAETKMTQLRTNKRALITWLQEHIFIGQLSEVSSEHEELMISMGGQHPVLSRVKGMTEANPKGLVLNVMDHLLAAKYTKSFKEGFVHVVEKI